MDGLNQSYTLGPEVFMGRNVLMMNPGIRGAMLDPRELIAGVQHFDIKPLGYPGGTELKFYIDAGQVQHVSERVTTQGGRLNAEGVMGDIVTQLLGTFWKPAPAVVPPPREAPIAAYWLPYEADRTREITLGNAANFFFTAGLTGCSVMVSGDPSAPRVAHINRTEEGSALFQRVVAQPLAAEEALVEQQARAHGVAFEKRTGKEAQTNRQLLFQELQTKVDARQSGRNTNHDILGYCKWGEHYRELCGVIGFRNQASGNWEFYYQRYRNQAAPPHLASLGFITGRDGALQRMA
ncbi:MAG: hypothetical protein ACN6QH_21565 [Pseudomonas sp.]|uniref:hypothetical protein n=1 Tax=Pseudomonas sp. TaxID=306 RepID=UPI003D0F0E87